MKNGKMKNDRQRTFMLITIPVVVLFFFFKNKPLTLSNNHINISDNTIDHLRENIYFSFIHFEYSS